MRKWSTPEILKALRSLDEAVLADEFVDLRTEEYRLLRYPERLLSPTLPPAQVVWSNTLRSLDLVFEEVASEVKQWGLDAIHWWVSSATHPLDTEAYLRAHGGVLSDSYQVLARELGDDAPENSRSTEINVELVSDERSLRDAIAVETRGWGRSLPDEQAISVRLTETLDNLQTSGEFHFVAYLAGSPAATASCRINGELARLYGAITLPEFRSHGCYSAVLSSRLCQARDLGAKVAVTRGRPSTSGPILAKAGFIVHDVENCYRLSIY